MRFLRTPTQVFALAALPSDFLGTTEVRPQEREQRGATARGDCRCERDQR